MQPVNMLEAKSTLSRLVQAVEEGRESEIVIARNGRAYFGDRDRSFRLKVTGHFGAS